MDGYVDFTIRKLEERISILEWRLNQQETLLKNIKQIVDHHPAILDYGCRKVVGEISDAIENNLEGNNRKR